MVKWHWKRTKQSRNEIATEDKTIILAGIDMAYETCWRHEMDRLKTGHQQQQKKITTSKTLHMKYKHIECELYSCK